MLIYRHLPTPQGVRDLRSGVIADTEGTPYGPGGEPAWTVLWLDGSTSIATDDELYIA